MAFDIRVIKISEDDGGGELRFLEQARQLPDDYIVIVGAVIGNAPSQQSQECDAIIIGPPGIFVLEVKNWAGQWTGTPTRWYRGLENKPSPLAAARKKWEALKDWLRINHGLFNATERSSHYWIDYGVVLTHPTADVSGVQDPAKDKYIFRLDDIAAPQLERVFRFNSVKRIEDYYEARQIADRLAPQSASELLAIDFGTTYSSVATYTPEGSPNVFRDSFNNALVPSVFGFQDKKEFVGRKALYALGSNRLRYSNFVPSIKTYLGVTEAQYSKLPPRQRPPNASFDKDGLVLRLDKRRFTVNEVAGRLFLHLRDVAKEHTARTWAQAVVSVPARFTHEQRSAVYHAARMAGFETVSLIDEPTAAALAFGLIHKYNGCVAVYDLGGGTFDFSVLDIANGVCTERAKIGKLVGGDDFDYRLYSDSKQYFAHTSGSPDVMDQLKDREQFLLSDACEKAKIALSGDEEATIILDNWRGATSLSRKVERPDFELLIEDLVRETIDTCKDGLVDAVNPKITDVLLVGGSTYIPLVRRRVSEFFSRPVRSDIDANFAVVYGAAIKAGMLMGRVKGALISSRVSPVTIGIPTSYAVGWWASDSESLTIEPIRERCSDTALLKLREALLFRAGRGSCKLDEVRGMIRESAAEVEEYSDGLRKVFFTSYSILHPIIGRSELIETDGQIVEFSRSFFTAADEQREIDLTILETSASRRRWQKMEECTKLIERRVPLNRVLPAAQNGIDVVLKFDRDGRLHVEYRELADEGNRGKFALDLLYQTATGK